MKICHLTTVHRYDDPRILLKQCTSLAQCHRYSVNLIAPNVKDKIINNVNIYGVGEGKKYSRLKRILFLRKQLYKKALKLDADVYHIHDPELIPIALRLSKKNKIVIYDVHEDVPRQLKTKHWIPNFLKEVVSSIYEWYENKQANKFNAIVTATPFIKERFIQAGCEHVINVNNYPLLNELLQVRNQKMDGKVFTYVGGLSRARGINEMMGAIQSIEGCLYLGGRFLNSSDEVEVKAKPEWKNVSFKGFVNREKLKKMFEMSRAGLVVLHPIKSYIDSLPVKMFEYMGAGIPVIASNFPGWKEIIDVYQCGICVDPLNEVSIAEAMEWILEHPEEAINMGERGRDAVKERYNWELESKKLICLYESFEM